MSLDQSEPKQAVCESWTRKGSHLESMYDEHSEGCARQPMMARYGADTAGTYHLYGKEMDFTHKTLSIGYETT